MLLGACVSAKEAAKDSRDCVLHLDFEKIVDGGFACQVSGEVCRGEGWPITRRGALWTSPNTRVSMPAPMGLDGRRELTVSAWIAPEPFGHWFQTIVYKGGCSSPGNRDVHFLLRLTERKYAEFLFRDAEGNWQGISRRKGNYAVSGQSMDPPIDAPEIKRYEWSHVAATFREGHVSLFVNGELIVQGKCPVEEMIPNSYPIRIGGAEKDSGEPANFMVGLVDEVRIHNRALGPTDMAALYAQDRLHKALGLVTEKVPTADRDGQFKTTLPLVAEYLSHTRKKKEPRKQVATSVKQLDGAATLHIDGKPAPAMAMMPLPYVADDQVTLACRDFAAAGLRLYSIILWSWMTPKNGCHSWWLGPGEYDFEPIDQRVRAVIAADPDALILPRIKLNPPAWWLEEHPDEIARSADGSTSRQVSLASAAWEECYGNMLRDVVQHMETRDYAGHIFGYHPAGGQSSEWYWWGMAKGIDFSPAAIARLRQWLAERYREDPDAGRRTWGDLDTAEPPSMAERQATEQLFFRNPKTARRVIDYRQFLCDMITHNIERSCKIAKDASGHRKIAGVFYGYSAYRAYTPGFYGLERVLDSPYVDFLCAPTMYGHRRGGEPGNHIVVYTGSCHLHSKLYWDEVDMWTHLCRNHDSYQTQSLEETVSTIQRAGGYALTKGTGLWWFALADNAAFHQAEVMDAIAATQRAGKTAIAHDRTPEREVAVFIDEPSMLYSNTNQEFESTLLRVTNDELACMGAPYDTYLLSDLLHPKLPDYKLHIFLNAFMVDDKIRQAVEAKVKQAGKTALWVYAPGYLTNEGFSETAMRDLTGITLRSHARRMPGHWQRTDIAHNITARMPKDRTYFWSVGPVFSVEDASANVLGRCRKYNALAVKEFTDWRSVYSMLPPTRELLLGLCRYAGVHVYSETLDPFFANQGYAMIHTGTAGSKRIVLPGARDVFDALTGTSIGRRVSEIRSDLPRGVTRIYRLAPPSAKRE